MADTSSLHKANTDSTNIHEAFREASQLVPRYLFGTWYPGEILWDGVDDCSLNTPTEVIPKAFRSGPRVQSISELSAEQLLDSWDEHESHGNANSHFSSWSANLQNEWMHAEDHIGAHIAVVDTTRLSAHNAVIWCGAESLEDIGRSRDEREYRIFGEFSGPDVYQSVPFDTIWSTVSDPGREYQLCWTFHETEEAIKFGKLFNGKFALLMAVAGMSMYKDVSADEAVLNRLLEQFNVSFDVVDGSGALAEWERLSLEDGGSLEDDYSEYLGWTALGWVDATLRALVAKQQRRQADAAATQMENLSIKPADGEDEDWTMVDA